MKIKKVAIIVCMLLVTTIQSLTALAGTPENPEVIDRKWDVKFFWFFPVLFQMEYKNVDIVAVWFHEENVNPDYLSISLKIRNIEEKTESFEAIYVVDWVWNNDNYDVVLHINPEGIHPFWVGRSMDGDDDIDDWILCDGIVDFDQNTITWSVPKEFIGNIPKGAIIRNIHPVTSLRFTDDSGLPLMDLFKDTALNAKTTKEYVIQY